MEPRLLSVEEAARRLGLPPSALRLAIKRGAIKPDVVTARGGAGFTAATLETYAKILAPSAVTLLLTLQPQTIARLAAVVAAGHDVSHALRDVLLDLQQAMPSFKLFLVVELLTPFPVTPVSSDHAMSAPATASVGSPIRIAAQIGYPAALLESFNAFMSRGNAAIPPEFTRGEAIFVDDLAAQHPVSGPHPLVRESRQRTAAALPLYAEGSLCGILEVSSHEPFAFTPQTKSMLAEAAQELARLLAYRRQVDRQGLGYGRSTPAPLSDSAPD